MRPDNWDDNHPFAPWRDTVIDIHHCGWGCGEIVEQQGQPCDKCLVDNATRCGDWDEESLEAQKRLQKNKTNGKHRN